MGVIARIQAYMEYKGLNDNQITKAANLSNGLIGKAKKTGKALTSVNIEKILNAYPELNSEWLLTGRGNMLNKDAEPNANAELLGFAKSATSDSTIPVRFYEPEPSATFKEFCDGVNESPETINIIPEKSDHIDDLSCVFKVSGDSMAPQIQNGAKVLCREVAPSRWHNVQQGVIAIVYDDRFVIKRVKKNCLDRYGDNYILLSSDNPEYSGTEKAYLGNIRCIFEVIRVISQRVY